MSLKVIILFHLDEENGNNDNWCYTQSRGAAVASCFHEMDMDMTIRNFYYLDWPQHFLSVEESWNKIKSKVWCRSNPFECCQKRYMNARAKNLWQTQICKISCVSACYETADAQFVLQIYKYAIFFPLEDSYKNCILYGKLKNRSWAESFRSRKSRARIWRIGIHTTSIETYKQKMHRKNNPIDFKTLYELYSNRNVMRHYSSRMQYMPYTAIEIHLNSRDSSTSCAWTIECVCVGCLFLCVSLPESTWKKIVCLRWMRKSHRRLVTTNQPCTKNEEKNRTEQRRRGDSENVTASLM